ncbi:DUF2627 domain-containing protein [Paenibacillus senegalensis]|uniref:DUF2627 domain-containing protein n=1 Tax=Paenibacillus senegalensis TaxID=1465766 RepID=UPI000287E010|nr:DUF2627 domain-containing protein [Paenibacillus senegalensis]
MRLLISRMIAALLLAVPGIAATYGFITMKDAFLSQWQPDQSFQWLRFLLGFVLFFGGVAFIAGWIFYRDRKRNYVAPRFKEKKARPRPRPTPPTE